ncbi:hypothetical protein ESCO_006106 [Escovopsis weberi]|uniref:Uncharacterized protein n=1 Tax=Escovopsis weberi TaxID=150374 RepID=A0A0M8MVE9_ESCWE|nr:hypothetical protein ESCO_006106 [Escovopsis weberi]
MPTLTIPSCDPPPPPSHPDSPPRPPMSPITPPLHPADIDIDISVPQPQPHPQPLSYSADHLHHQQPAPNPFARTHAYSHSQPDQVAIPQPPPIPISLDANPDAIALRAALAALQVQKMRATSDIRALSTAKHQALQHPLEFTQDLLAGMVQTRDTDEDRSNDDGPPAWRSLPRPQDVVRCPPINWSQYAVVGESLERLHAEQLAAPAQGSPATLGPGGVYEFRAGAQEPYRGVASPYSPLCDRVDTKAKRR